MVEFGKSIVVHGNEAPRVYAKALQELKSEDDELSFDEYWAFVQAAERIDEIRDAIHLFLAEGETVSRAHFKRAVFAVTGTHLTEPVSLSLFVCCSFGFLLLLFFFFCRFRWCKLLPSCSTATVG